MARGATRIGTVALVVVLTVCLGEAAALAQSAAPEAGAAPASADAGPRPMTAAEAAGVVPEPAEAAPPAAPAPPARPRNPWARNPRTTQGLAAGEVLSGTSPWSPGPPRDHQAVLRTVYRAQSKSEAVAVIAEFLFPGLGSVYAGHVAGAALTWGLELGGMVLVLSAIASDDGYDSEDARPSASSSAMILVGAGMVVGGRIWGFFDAYTSARSFNTSLREKLGLPDWVSVGVAPVVTEGPRPQLVAGPILGARF